MTITATRRGRPRRGEVRQPHIRRAERGRPIGRRMDTVTLATFRLGREYIAILDRIATDRQINKSVIVRECINRLAVRCGLPTATYMYPEREYRPSSGTAHNEAGFALGDEHKSLLAQMATSTGVGQKRGGMTQLIREELVRLAMESGYMPVAS